jgi:hypothetical protein
MILTIKFGEKSNVSVLKSVRMNIVLALQLKNVFKYYFPLPNKKRKLLSIQ